VSALFAFAAAFSNALNLVTQHVASTAAPAKDKGWRLAVYLVTNPLWLLGSGALLGGFVFQALALYKGRLSVVQAILVTELVFSLLIGRIWLRRPVRGAAWASASVTGAGLALFLAMSQPEGGHANPTRAAWLPVLLTMGGAVVALCLVARSGPDRRRAACYATASGIVWATTATLIKAATDAFASGGVVGLFEHGAVYGVAVTGLLGTILTQAALHRGPLAVSQSLMVIVDPLVSILLGVWLFGERFTHPPAEIAAGALGFATMVVGVVCLTRTAPSFEARTAAATTGGEREVGRRTG
jgi:drug/metabolite transporter (DMT)-like permease